eukprot:5399686-Pleurochrysis_carterae.AAC.1
MTLRYQRLPSLLRDQCSLIRSDPSRARPIETWSAPQHDKECIPESTVLSLTRTSFRILVASLSTVLH